jgi:hypothetical protein
MGVVMDFTAVFAAVTLLVILLGWYALLEYEDRRQGENARSSKPLKGGGGRGSKRLR